MGEVSTPFGKKTGRDFRHSHTKEIFDLGRKDSHGYARSETYDNGIRDEFYQSSQLEDPHKYQHDSRQNGSYYETLDSKFSHNAGHYYDKSSGRTPYQEM